MHLKGKEVFVEDPRFSLADDLAGTPFADTLKKTNPHQTTRRVCALNPALEACALKLWRWALGHSEWCDVPRGPEPSCSLKGWSL